MLDGERSVELAINMNNSHYDELYDNQREDERKFLLLKNFKVSI